MGEPYDPDAKIGRTKRRRDDMIYKPRRWSTWTPAQSCKPQVHMAIRRSQGNGHARLEAQQNINQPREKKLDHTHVNTVTSDKVTMR